MVVLVTCKNEEEPIKIEGKNLIHQFFRCTRADNSGVGGGILPNLNSSKLSCMSSLPARMRMIRCSRAANSTVLSPIWPNFKLVRDVMDVLVTCKYEEDPIKNEGARVFTTFSAGAHWPSG